MTHATQGQVSQKVTQIAHAIILSLNESAVRGESGTGCPIWRTAVQSSTAKTSMDLLPWTCRSLKNELVDKLASTADITYGLPLGSAEVLRSLRKFSNMDRPEVDRENDGKATSECGLALNVTSYCKKLRTARSGGSWL